jgi:hypothetical protein
LESISASPLHLCWVVNTLLLTLLSFLLGVDAKKLFYFWTQLRTGGKWVSSLEGLLSSLNAIYGSSCNTIWLPSCWWLLERWKVNLLGLRESGVRKRWCSGFSFDAERYSRGLGYLFSEYLKKSTGRPFLMMRAPAVWNLFYKFFLNIINK